MGNPRRYPRDKLGWDEPYAFVCVHLHRSRRREGELPFVMDMVRQT